MELFMYTLRSLAYVVMEPSLMLILILLGIMFFTKNKKITDMQKMVIGDKVNSALELTLSQIVLGILAGIVISLILSNLGVVFLGNSGVQLLFFISILMMVINSRFVCFSYSASILGAISLVFTYFNIKTSSGAEILRIDIMCLMTFVGIMHIIEGFLVMIDGDKGAIPVFSNKEGKIVGGYAFKRYWVLPIAIFIAFVLNEATGGATESIATPSFWPIIKTPNILTIISTMGLSLIPFFGIVGYSSVTFTRKKKEKVMHSGASILIFGLMLVLVSQLANFGLVGQIVVLIFSPLAHEAMIRIQKKIEEKRESIFISDSEGISVLEVVPYSLAYESGIRIGDKILKLNNEEILDITEVHKQVGSGLYPIELTVKKSSGEMRKISIKSSKGNVLGAVLVPRAVTGDKIVALDSNFKDVLNKIKQKRKDIK